MNRVYAFLLFVLLLPAASVPASEVQQLIQLVDYMGVDYEEAVVDGKVINDAEYAEMQEFASAIQSQVAALPGDEVVAGLKMQALTLADLVADKKDAIQVREVTAAMRLQIISHFDVLTTPSRLPDLVLGQALYSQNCVSCHGAEGRGDGELAQGLEPAPTNFRERERYLQRTLHGLYSTITLGVDETAMAAYSGLSEHERWSLVFYVGQLAATATEAQQGQALWQSDRQSRPLADLEKLTTTTPAETAASDGSEGLALMAFLRTRPQMLLQGKESPLTYSLNGLAASLKLYKEHKTEQAHSKAVDAYLEGFELVESSLNAVDSDLRKGIEKGMTNFRSLIRQDVPVGQLEQQYAQVTGLIEQARSRLDDGAVSGSTAFSGAFIILLREGLEALLVVAALAAFLIKTGRRDGLPFLYAGIGFAGVLGILTWLASVTLVDISGAQRELTEGFAAIVAAAVLFYLGFWLHSKTSASQWKKFIEQSVQKALNRKTLWGLAGLSFIAVYREIFETVLFYQALWIQADAAGQGLILSGMLSAAALLAVLAWLILRYSARLPLRQFFAVTGVFMFLLAVIFAGHGVAALQEAGHLAMNPLNLPSVELLGIYPNIEGLLLQLAMVSVALYMLLSARMERKRLVKEQS